MTSVMAHFHQTPGLCQARWRETVFDGEPCAVLSFETQADNIDLFFYGDAIQDVKDALSRLPPAPKLIAQ